MDWDCGFSMNSPEFMGLGSEEMEELRSEKTVQATKSPEEIEKQMVDETLSLFDKTELLLRTGQELQKVYAVQQLPSLLKSHKDQSLNKIIPKICNMLPSASVKIQAAAGRSLGVALSKNLIPNHILSSSLLPLIIRFIHSRDSTVSSVWLEVLMDVIPSLTKDTIRRDILSLAVARSQLSQTVSSRKSGCLIFAALASKFEPFWLRREVFPQVKSLCQDVDSEVRITMCSQLHLFAKHMNPDLAKSCVLPELKELTSDEEPLVREAALEAIANTIPHLPPDVVKTTVIPLVQKICQLALSSAGPDLTGVARLLGKLSHQLKDVMTTELRDWFVKFYCQLSQFNEPISQEPPPPPPPSRQSSVSPPATPTSTRNGIRTECRRLCAYNIPAMVKMVGAQGYTTSKLNSTIQDLVSDDSPHVRHTVACGYHEVVLLLGDKSMNAISVYQKLLGCKSVEVLQGLSSHIPEIIKIFTKSANLAPDTKYPGLAELIAPLIIAEGVASGCRQWRLHEQIIKGFSSLVHCLTTDQLFNRIVPVLRNNITGKVVRPVKMASCQSLAIVLRHLRKSEQRSAVIDCLIRECAESSRCHNRILYLDLCTIILSIFSRAFFKRHFFSPALTLGKDPVVNVRLRLCRLLPTLKTTLKLPADRGLLQELEDAVRQLLLEERDVDTSNAIRSAVLELDRIQVAMETLMRRTFFEADQTDKEKEEEERRLLQSEEKEKEGGGGGGGGGGKKSAKNSPALPRSTIKKKAVKTTSVPLNSPNMSSNRSGSISTLTQLTISSTSTSSSSPAHSPQPARQNLTVPRPKGAGVAVGGVSPPTIHRSQSGISMTRCGSVESGMGTGLISFSVPGSPHPGVKPPRPKTSSSANSSPNTGTKTSRSREPSMKRKPHLQSSLKGKRTT